MIVIHLPVLAKPVKKKNLSIVNMGKLGEMSSAHVAVAGSTKNAIQDEYGFDKNSIEFKLGTKADLM